MPISRRRFLLGSAGVAAAGTVGRFAPASAFGGERALRRALDRTVRSAAAPQGTTLTGTIVPVGRGPYRRLVDGPGEPTSVRADLALPGAGRDDVRVPLASFVHFTDQHLIDAQSPGRVEFIDVADPIFQSAFRPQELLTTHVATSMVDQVGRLGRGPITGRGFDAVVCTGDNIDNQQVNEMAWLLAILDGGPVVPDSGAFGTYEGVQDGLDAHPFVWHPEPGQRDDYKALGYPELPGLLERALRPFSSPGLGVPWFSVYGNHDCNVQGNAARTDALDEIFTSDLKMTDLPAGTGAFAFVVGVMFDSPRVLADLRAGRIPARAVTPDPARRTATVPDWIGAHLASPTGSHGYHPDDLAQGRLYYEFELAPGVIGVSLDTTNHAGGPAGSDGSMGQGQLDWLEERLVAHSSRHLDRDGRVVETGSTDHVVVLFSHHPAGSITATDRDPSHPDERRVLGPEVLALLVRYPNVVAWVNGHTHTNGITAHRDPTGVGPGFWEITTASHVDWPQQARVIEIADNRDGTLSIFATMIEHAAPAVFDPQGTDVASLAALSRELGANDANAGPGAKAGDAADRNVELIRAAPWLATTGPTTTTSITTASPSSSSTSTPSSTTSTAAPSSSTTAPPATSPTTAAPTTTPVPSAPVAPSGAGGGVALPPAAVPVGGSPGYTG